MGFSPAPDYKLPRFDDGVGNSTISSGDPDELNNVIDCPDVALGKADLQRQLEAWERQYRPDSDKSYRPSQNVNRAAN